VNNIFELGVGVVLLCVGLIAVIQKKFSMGLGPARGGSAHPLFTINITGIRAVIFGLEAVISAVAIFLIWLRYNPLQGSPIDDTGIVGFAALCAIGISLICFVICAFFEILHFLGQRNKE
jgi:hypothetical protein